MRLSTSGFTAQPEEGGEKKCLNSELWHACAGPLVALPTVGSRVVYFPQGHSEQVAASTNKEVDTHMPNYPGLPPQLICQLHNVTMHADVETEEVYAQMTLQPLSPQEQKDGCLLPAELGGPSKQPTNYFCKTLTASDTSTHGGFSVPRRAAEKVFPPLDYSQQPPAQELMAKDLHGNEWKFRHIFRGQPKRHLLTTGWSVFVSAKKLVAGDSVIFIWNENNQLLLGIRRATRSPSAMPSSVLSSDSMHIGLLAAAAHAAATSSRFTIFYNPRACPSEFVIPLAKYAKAVHHTRVSVGMRFRMLFETEESSVRRYMGTITGISDLDPVRWPNSHWRSVKVGWDESTTGERQPRVSLWEIEPLTTFPMYPSPFSLRLKRPWPLPSFPGLGNGDPALNSQLSWLRGDIGDQGIQSLNFQGFGSASWKQPRLNASLLGLQSDTTHQAMAVAALQEAKTLYPSKLASHSLFPFQHSGSGGSVALLRNQMLQKPISQQNFVQSFPENIVSSQPLMMQHSFPHYFSSSEQQQELQKEFMQPSHLHLEFQQPQLAKTMSNLPKVESTAQQSSPLQTALASPCQQQAFTDHHENHLFASNNSSMQGLLNTFSLDGVSQLVNLNEVNNLVTSSAFPKRIALDSQISRGAVQSEASQTNSNATPISKISELSSMLPCLGGREFSHSQFQGMDSRSNAFFGLDSNYFNVLQNGTSNFATGGGENESLSMPFAISNHTDATGPDFQLNSATATSSCVDESAFLQSSGNLDQVNSSSTFVKVHKAGSFGRSIDISKYSSYHELRSELALLFGLEGLLEDPQRSGWQLVFIDRENDILLLGDDPWQEFLNSVWYIKILSPLEVQQMGKEGLPLLSSVSTNRIPGGVGRCDDYVSQIA